MLYKSVLVRKLKTTSTFRKDLKKLNASDTKETTAVIVKLQKDEPLGEKKKGGFTLPFLQARAQPVFQA